MPKMYFTFTTLVIFSCICSEVYSRAELAKAFVTKGCSIRVSEDVAGHLPIIFTQQNGNAEIINPDRKGNLYIDLAQSVQIACVKTNFQNVSIKSTEILITCVGNDNWVYQGVMHDFFYFICTDTPISELKVTKEKCQKGNSVVAKVGFQTNNHFLDLYSICFNKSSKSTSYTWYYTKPPYFRTQQRKDRMLHFIINKELYGQTNMDLKYNFYHQVLSMSKSLGSEKLAKTSLVKQNESFLSRGHLVSKSEFFFAYQQNATFFYANTAPQWLPFNKHIWTIVERTIKSMIRASFTARHLVVTGTYGTSTLTDVNGIQKTWFLDEVNNISVPLFFWKLLYNLDDKNGLVYIALNNPFMKIDHDTYICKNVCPKTFSEIPGFKKNFVHCCTIESFEKAYGKLDSILFDGEMAKKFLPRTPEKVAQPPPRIYTFRSNL